jgi:hypothetical protein
MVISVSGWGGMGRRGGSGVEAHVAGEVAGAQDLLDLRAVAERVDLGPDVVGHADGDGGQGKEHGRDLLIRRVAHGLYFLKFT